MVRYTLRIAAILAVAVTTVGCRHEMPVPAPRGLGAADIAVELPADR